MRKLYAAALLGALALAAAAAPAGASDTTGGAIGATVADFTLPDADGREHSLASLRGKNGTVLIFVSTQCPISNAYDARMEKLSQDLRALGVNVVGINSNATESPADVKQHAAAKKLSFPILKDGGNRIADRLDARVTPEAYFLDASNKLVYRGRIDNSRNGDAISSQELREAVEATLAGRPVAKTEVRAFGCSIKRG
ncbi:MAG TPA: thioredoxin family protein [Pyrinomonadaceae bacterium]|nr:thioredoxin family protein [Pyrinomonadaceae bacterium]HWS86825.1 thioredoxin family protein [Pyrinomonadaceae bacterium]